MHLIDSSAWLAWVADEPAAPSFAEAFADPDLILVPTACLHEVFKVLLRERGEDLALVVAATMQESLVVALDSSLALEAAALGLEEGLAFADSVIYATAVRHGATLWTQDACFRGKPGVRYVPKVPKPG